MAYLGEVLGFVPPKVLSLQQRTLNLRFRPNWSGTENI
jgi:hypothetical protein